MKSKLIIAGLLASLIGCASTSQPSITQNSGLFESNSLEVRKVGIYVTPYYSAAVAASEKPTVSVAKNYDSLLSSNDPADILKAEELIKQSPELITPMTLMVLSIRLYDVGLRDKSVFWFYVAKDRFITLSEVLDLSHPALAQVEQATADFATLAGPVINGYAFCSIENQQTQRSSAFDWVSNNPYQAMFIEQLPARGPNREESLNQALRKIEQMISQEQAFLSDPANIELMKAARDTNNVDAQYCWR
ncbi:hypothetical protein [Motilimonas eburnea]|uniref:hypothetical protein n=1 Tax=Motilimonas eburnea TaxID=1737488 RepID=UPI001E5020B8|nr:hypothetical protein [Motilimonas eburnea]MCE2572461.1 hypothetical protein [Motilimonas eburnea]